MDDQTDGQKMAEAAAQVLDLVAETLTTAQNGLEVERADALTLAIDWPLDTDHPQPPWLPPGLRLVIEWGSP